MLLPLAEGVLAALSRGWEGWGRRGRLRTAYTTREAAGMREDGQGSAEEERPTGIENLSEEAGSWSPRCLIRAPPVAEMSEEKRERQWRGESLFGGRGKCPQPAFSP